MELKEFYKNKNVLITGHTGFKGSWMCMLLKCLGANVTGYALSPNENELFEICNVSEGMKSVIGDIVDLDSLKKVFEKSKPDIVIHMAAQPLVRESYKNPVGTYETNVMGTVNVIECIRQTDSVKSFINVTTDKVYRNEERMEGYREEEYLDGYDPYSNSKSCSELVTSSYKKSFFGENGRQCAISTCRAGNVIGGGDFATDRIIPDCIRAIKSGNNIIVRNPKSIRPYQHVLEPVVIYLTLAMEQWNNSSISGAYNIGPEDYDCITTGELVDRVCKKWKKLTGLSVDWNDISDGGPHEANLLRLNCNKLKETLCWKPRWSLDESLDKLVEWYVSWINKEDMKIVSERQIIEFMRL